MRTAIAIVVTLGILPALGICQRTPPPYYEDTNNLPVSPEVLSDRRVTFRLFAPKASEVILMGSPGILEVLKEPKPLQKDEKGVWSLTVGPLAPGFYSYGYSVDGGIRSPDPSNPNLELRRWGPTSFFEVPGNEPAIFEKRPVPHGTIHVNFYDSKSLGMPRMFYVYTPPGYERAGSQRYPVLYLLHGSSQIEASWTWTGHANVILDNLLAGGKIKPMIVVMPYGHVPREQRPAPPGSGASDAAGIENDILTDVRPLVESNYRVINDRDHRAIAGLSMGGGQSLSIALHNLDLFSQVASFSGSVSYRADLEKADPAVLNQKLKLIWMGCGTDDSLFNSNKAIADWLTAKQVRHTFYTSGGGHSWPNWQVYLSKLAPLLFRD